MDQEICHLKTTKHHIIYSNLSQIDDLQKQACINYFSAFVAKLVLLTCKFALAYSQIYDYSDLTGIL